MKCPSKHVGSRNELIACAWLLEQGYEVFRNVSQHGEIDIIAMRGDDILKLDIKSGSSLQSGEISASKISNTQFLLGVKRLIVMPDGRCVIDRESITGAMSRPTKLCASCSKTFAPRTTRQTFCKKSCSEIHFLRKKRAKAKENGIST